MKRVLLCLVLVFALIGFLPAQSQAQNVNNFSISDFEVDYDLRQNNDGVGTLTVSERIVAEFPDFDQNRGIERSIPQEYEGFDLGLKILSVTNENGSERPYTTYESNNQTVVRIGNPLVFVRGTNEYNITYQMSSVITFEENQDVFRWDVNGTDWRVPIENVQARITLDPDIAVDVTGESECFTGAFGATAIDCTIERDGTTVVATSTTNFGPGENLTVSVPFEDGTFSQDQSQLYKKYALYAVAIAAPLAAALVMGRKWWREGRDVGKRGVVVPQYVPRDELSVLEASMMLNYKLEPKDISAQIIALAVEGYITLHETKKDKLIGKDDLQYELELIKPVTDRSEDEQTIVTKLFGTPDAVGAKVKLEDKANSLHSTLTSLNSKLAKSLTRDKYFRSNPQHVVGWHVAAGIVIGVALTILGGMLESPPILISGIVTGIIIVAFGIVMPALTKKGSAAREYLQGVEDYVGLAESERIKYLQSPEGASRYGDPTEKGTKIKLFETLLPYAIVFGLEKDWAKEFSDLYIDEQPRWMNSTTAFNAAHLSRSMSSFNNATSTAFSPSSSSSSGGGGFSGGGGGGGGGGGW